MKKINERDKESDIKIKCYDADMKLMDAQYNDNSDRKYFKA